MAGKLNLLAHLVSLISGLPADGYNPIYQYAVAFAALFWLWAGMETGCPVTRMTARRIEQKTAGWNLFLKNQDSFHAAYHRTGPGGLSGHKNINGKCEKEPGAGTKQGQASKGVR